MGKREQVSLLCLSVRCPVIIIVLWGFLTVLWVGLLCVFVVFSDHPHIPFRCNGLWYRCCLFVFSLCVFLFRLSCNQVQLDAFFQVWQSSDCSR